MRNQHERQRATLQMIINASDDDDFDNQPVLAEEDALPTLLPFSIFLDHFDLHLDSLMASFKRVMVKMTPDHDGPP
ncbi:hypothetical protein E2C01_043850 [Portunus trituberculatus]|uniref:Uncharacterized protein n=1 Tax=Portunus trituberculatus TaxID=210409 RepID=A0A5B7FRD2_PORTR|nr:hypothetical protein [Portunus trituberculatus]